MLPKKNRLSKKEFNQTYTHGENISGDTGYMKITKTHAPTKVSCVVSSNEADTSTERTRVRRRGYAAVEDSIDDIPDEYNVIWFLPASAESGSLADLCAAFTDMLDKHGVFCD